jgi:hypothetical protein
LPKKVCSRAKKRLLFSDGNLYNNGKEEREREREKRKQISEFN